MTPFLFKAAFCAYLLSTLGYVTSILGKRVRIARASLWLMSAAFGFHSLFLLFRIVERGHIPILGYHEVLNLFAWIMAGIFIFFQFRTRTVVLGAFVSPVVLLMMIYASRGIGSVAVMPAVLKGNLVPVHVLLSVTGEALFALASCAGAMYLLQDHFLKRKKARRVSSILPSLGDLDRINHLCLLWGFPLLTLGVLMGAFWARVVWGSSWQWDPKQVWTLAVWGTYAVLLHQRLAIGWKGHKTAVFSLLAFLFFLTAFLVGKNLFPTIHRFV
ncbi:inner membrane protein YpjD [Syntrophus sp. (in: bacteria)]|jgi:cytochrome c-type biogenesis protein CcsB|uniref:cytochrome C assembly family protein n=1 Tax=Syntrophus sp. (in: bacteria) TaxID=48412 RepID=UPI00345E62F2